MPSDQDDRKAAKPANFGQSWTGVDDLPDVELDLDTIVYSRMDAISGVMTAFFDVLAIKFGATPKSFRWHAGLGGDSGHDVEMHFDGAKDDQEVALVHEMWVRLRQKYQSVLIGSEWMKLREKFPTYARLGPSAFASAFKGRVSGKT